MSTRSGTVVCLAAALLTGCTQSLDRRTQSRVIASADPDEVFAAAILVLRRHDFRRLEIDRDARRVESAPVAYAGAGGSARDLVNARSSLRRIAQLSVAPRNGGSVARVRVEIERQETAQRGVVQYEGSRISDAPGHTPIQRDAATTEAQNTVWALVRRDTALERVLLDDLSDTLTPPIEEPAAQEAADGPPRE